MTGQATRPSAFQIALRRHLGPHRHASMGKHLLGLNPGRRCRALLPLGGPRENVTASDKLAVAVHGPSVWSSITRPPRLYRRGHVGNDRDLWTGGFTQFPR